MYNFNSLELDHLCMRTTPSADNLQDALSGMQRCIRMVEYVAAILDKANEMEARLAVHILQDALHHLRSLSQPMTAPMLPAI